VVNDGDAVAVLQLPLDLVPEHDPGLRPPHLLQVGPAEPARANAHEQARSRRLWQLDELRQAVVVEGDSAQPALH